MSFDQRPQKIRVVADRQKPPSAQPSAAARAAGPPAASARDPGPVTGGKPVNASARSQGALLAETEAAAASGAMALATERSTGSGWIIAALLFVLASAVGGAAAMAAFFR